MKIGLFGGTFDPVHNAHLIIAQVAYEMLGLDYVMFMPAAIPPHKTTQNISAAEIRWTMLNLALEGQPHFKASRMELDRKGISYTVLTIEQIKRERQLTRQELVLIIGADSLMEIGIWRQPELIFEGCEVAVYPRPNISWNNVSTQFASQVIRLEAPLLEISSTHIRKRVQKGLPIHFFVPPQVEEFIKSKNLYRING